MNDAVREAFEKWRATQSCPSSWAARLFWMAWHAAWQQSRREALMEAASICSDAADKPIGRDDYASGYIWACESLNITLGDAARAAAEENGRE